MNILTSISVVGVVVGSVLDVVLSAVAGGVLTLGIASPDLPSDQYQRLVENAIFADRNLLFKLLVAGSFCSILGGYVAARIAKRKELLNGTLSSCLCVGGSLYAMATGSTFWLDLMSIVLSPAFALLGGFLSLKCRKY